MQRRGHRGQGGPCPRRGKCDLDLDEGSRGPWEPAAGPRPAGRPVTGSGGGAGLAPRERLAAESPPPLGGLDAAAHTAVRQVSGCSRRPLTATGSLPPGPRGVVSPVVQSAVTQEAGEGETAVKPSGSLEEEFQRARMHLDLAGGGIPRAGRTEGKHGPGPSPLGSGSCPALPWRVTGDKQLGPPKPHCPRPGLVLTLLPAPWAC